MSKLFCSFDEVFDEITTFDKYYSICDYFIKLNKNKWSL
jgi:hypothetical protein